MQDSQREKITDKFECINQEIESFIKAYIETIKDTEKFLYITRDKKFQMKSKKELEKLRKKAAQLKKELIKKDNEEGSNLILALEYLIKAFKSQLEMWILLKKENYNESFNELVDAQDFLKDSINAHEIAEELNAENYQRRLEITEKILFPPQTFTSLGMTISRFECSVCGENYEDCEHIAGEAYQGEICSKVARDIKAEEASLVEEPASKKHRIYSFKEGKEKWRDIMTWQILNEKTEKKDG